MATMKKIQSFPQLKVWQPHVRKEMKFNSTENSESELFSVQAHEYQSFIV